MKKLLIIDDEIDLLKMLGKHLKEQGYDVTTRNTGRKGLNAVRKEPYDLVLIDIRMPGMDGIDTARQIERVQYKAKFLIITGYAITEELTTLLEQDKRVKGYLLKPFDLNELLAMMKEVI